MKKEKMIELLLQFSCKKGCGCAEIELYCDELICSCCGEEIYDEIPLEQQDFAKKWLKKNKMVTFSKKESDKKDDD